MPASAIPSSHADLFQKKAFANLATLMPDGKPQVTPVWVEFDGHHVIINTAEGRQKDKSTPRPWASARRENDRRAGAGK